MTGYQSKKAMSQDKLNDDDDTQVYGDALTIAYQSGYHDGKKAAQPAQEPPPWWPAVENILEEYGLQAIDFVADFNAALAGRERNFCERCGKRTADLTTIHTCTPPQEQQNG